FSRTAAGASGFDFPPALTSPRPSAGRPPVERCSRPVSSRPQKVTCGARRRSFLRTCARSCRLALPPPLRRPASGSRLRAPACGHGWQADLDVGAFVLAEVDAHAARLLGEVHGLAHAYGWSEADILALSTARRRRYLELAWS